MATTLESALRTAGFVPASERLNAVAKKCLLPNYREWDTAKARLREALRNDPELCYEAMGKYREAIEQGILTKAVQEIRAGECIPKQVIKEHVRRAPLTPEEKLRQGRVIADLIQGNLLETFIINGQPLGKVIVREARGWAHQRTMQGRFVSRLVAGLPDESRVGDHRRAEDTQAVFTSVAQEMEGE